MKRRFREVDLIYYNPTALTDIMDEASASELSWIEMIEHIYLGHDELIALLGLSEKADLSIREIICLYLYYWEELSEPAMAIKLSIPQKTISNTLIRAKKKLHPQLLAKLARNA